MPFDSTLNPTTDVILGAIDYLETYGWCKGSGAFYDRRCFVAALYEAAGGHTHVADRAIARVKAANGIEVDLPFWNDAQERTKEQVIGALRNTLAYAPETVG